MNIKKGNRDRECSNCLNWLDENTNSLYSSIGRCGIEGNTNDGNRERIMNGEYICSMYKEKIDE